jgi:SHS2 domain-containing protein
MLVKFLNELFYMFYIRKRLPKDPFCFIKFRDGVLTAESDFAKVKAFLANSGVKAVTYGNIKTEHKNNLYETTVIADV